MVSARSCASSNSGVGPGVNSLSLMIPGISLFSVHSFRLGEKLFGAHAVRVGPNQFQGHIRLCESDSRQEYRLRDGGKMVNSSRPAVVGQFESIWGSAIVLPCLTMKRPGM